MRWRRGGLTRPPYDVRPALPGPPRKGQQLVQAALRQRAQRGVRLLQQALAKRGEALLRLVDGAVVLEGAQGARKMRGHARQLLSCQQRGVACREAIGHSTPRGPVYGTMAAQDKWA